MNNKPSGRCITLDTMEPLDFKRQIANDRIGRMVSSQDEFPHSDLDCLKCPVPDGCNPSSPDCILKRKVSARRAKLNYKKKDDGSYYAKFKDVTISIGKHDSHRWFATISRPGQVFRVGIHRTFKAVKEECRKAFVSEFS